MSKALLEGKYFRVYPIAKVVGINNITHKLDIITCDIKNGLAIEKRCKDNEHYYVVAFVQPIESASLDDGLELKDVAFRTIDMIDEGMSMEDFCEMMQEYKNCVSFATQTILDLQEKK